ncbi:Betaine--homocysteine S-methyltransferase 1 [Amphibalanus amphitrite]|uniref:Betaine--homocysteine S-methyltransferase 1 n=1 Tax=Amphibalanus amphitrite TaxID=1232801 RepID=A0A6A4XGL9_AMPAM|nr:Betaine--homocysteine S-methyltransferase 1 [Amphibalanus amphitrite]
MMPGSSTSNAKKGLLERLQDGVVIGDGGMMSEMCRRGYAITGIWTPEVCVQHPSAVRELHREFARAGAGVLQALNFYSNDQKMKERGLDCTVEDINRAACRYLYSFIWLFDIHEMELAITAGRSTGLPVVACMTIGTRGDRNGVTPEQCALRMASAGADVVGMNCAVGPRNALATIRRMRIALESAGLSRPLIVQPNGLKTPDDGTEAHHLPGWPLAMEPHVMNRLEARAFAREAYKEGVRYIGGCCYSTVYHIRAMAEELQEEAGGVAPLASHSGGWAPELANNDDPQLAKRSTKEYWMNVCPTAVEPKPAAEFMAGWADCCGC